MNLRRWPLQLVAILFVTGSLFLARPAAAATPTREFNLTTSPLPVSLVTTPGHAINTTIRVQNSGTIPAHIKVTLMKFKAAGTTGQPRLLSRQPGDDYFDWVSFSKTNFTAQPGEWNNVDMAISPPADSGFGYYYAVLFSNDSPSLSTSQPGSSLNGAVATLVLLNVKAPGEKIELKISGFSSNKGVYEYLPATFNVTVHNNGNIHAVPSGSIFISKGGKNLDTLDVNPGGGNVLPQSNRIFSATWRNGFPVFMPKTVGGQEVTDKNGHTVQNLSWKLSDIGKFRFGHFNAHVLLAYDNGTNDVPIEANLQFWVIPWKLLAILLLILAIIGYGLFIPLRRMYKGARSAGSRIGQRRGK